MSPRIKKPVRPWRKTPKKSSAGVPKVKSTPRVERVGTPSAALTRTRKRIATYEQLVPAGIRNSWVKPSRGMKKSGPSDFVMIGYEKVYTQQSEVADQVMQCLGAIDGARTRQEADCLRTPVITLQPQQGKTGALIAIIDAFIDRCIADGKTFQVIVLCGLPQTSLADQTTNRLTTYTELEGGQVEGAELDIKARQSRLSRYPGFIQKEGIVISHNTRALKTSYVDLAKTKVDRRLILIDEQHLGNNRDGNLDTFLRSCGIKMSEQIHTWEKVNGTTNYVVGISATPFAHIILSSLYTEDQDPEGLQGRTLFKIIYKSPTDTYNSIEAMLKNGRLQAIEPLFVERQPSKFLEEVHAKFQKDCKEQGAGYLVIRAMGETHDDLMRYINRHGDSMQVRTFDGMGRDGGNIQQLTEYLGQKPKQPVWVVIRGAMRAGMTLPKTNYIRAWVESRSDNCDAQIQAGLGRACGYGREQDTYPIYCHLKSAQKAIAVYEGLRVGKLNYVPAGLQNTAARKQQGYKITLMEKDAAYAERDRLNVGLNRPAKWQISTIKGNSKTDLAARLLRGKPDSDTTFGFYVDEPARQNKGEGAIIKKFLPSWRLLVKRHPEWVGKVIRFDKMGSSFGGTRDHHKKRSALKEQ